MKKAFAVLLVIGALFGTAVMASAERGNIGGIGISDVKKQENGSIIPLVKIAEHGEIGGVGVR